jgi:predicted O-methyltransferase YrrM
MSNFTNYLPDNYYATNIIEKFKPLKMIDGNIEFHLRNGVFPNTLTLNHLEVIDFFVRLLRPNNFLELGVQFGETTNRIINNIPETYYAVDIEITDNIKYFSDTKPNFKFFNGTTDAFFKWLDETGQNLQLEMAFIDACHTHEASYNDFLNIRKHMKQDGIIFFHDTYPADINWTIDGLCSDCYKTVEIIRKNHSDEFEIVTLPIHPGLSIARKCTKQMSWLSH